MSHAPALPERAESDVRLKPVNTPILAWSQQTCQHRKPATEQEATGSLIVVLQYVGRWRNPNYALQGGQ
jgi:hypothetical protein